MEPTIEESFDDITGNMRKKTYPHHFASLFVHEAANLPVVEYCPELRDLVGIFSDSAQQLAHLRIREGQSQESHLPEVTRRESGIEVSRCTVSFVVKYSFSFACLCR